MAAHLPVVGIGASAGGVEALEAFFKSVPADSGLAFVVVTHLAPDRESMLAEILGRATKMPVVDAQDGRLVEAEHVYVLPPGAILTIHDGRLQLHRTGLNDHERAPIDVFFNALAEDQAEHAIGVVLSGSGSDGSIGLKAIKENGGLTIAQGSNTSRPRFAEMPSSAVAAGFVDLELPVEEIPERIVAYVRNWNAFDPEQPSDALTRIYTLLRTRTGHDFTEYKERTFQRRVQRRMQVVQTRKLEEYADRLEQQPEEINALFRDLLIGVTDFFRDPAAYESLEAVIPQLFENKGADEEVRVWVAGCSTGEEAYSIAILLREHLEKFPAPPRVQLFATDIDEAALTVARAARYSANVVKLVSEDRLQRFFIKEANYYQLVKEVRDMCIFSTHSLIRDPPFSRLDLISCRNLMIYMKPSLQAQIIPLFHYSLRTGGCLFLGASENVSRHSDLFVTLDRKNRLFRRRELVSRPILPLRQFIPYSRRELGVREEERSGLLHRSDLLRRIANTIVEHFGPAYVIVDETAKRSISRREPGNIFKPLLGHPIATSLRWPGQACALIYGWRYRVRKPPGRRVIRDRVAVQVDGGIQMIRVVVEPVSEGTERAYGIVFTDEGSIRKEEDGDGAEKRDTVDTTIRQLEQELQETRERLQSTIEELETANEEFRSSNEELLSVNEEMQSTNEELETSKEELQSVNEELQTVNNELNIKIDQLDRANADLYNLFQSTQVATIFLDNNLVIRSFTPDVTKLFNLIAGDQGRPLTDLSSRLVYPNLKDDISQVFNGKVIERAVKVSDGSEHYLARLLPYRTPDNVIDGVLLTFVNVTNIIEAEEQQKVLTAELSHRVKNTLAVVSSIAERTLPDGDLKTELIGRFHALGHTHDLLADAGWTEARLRDVIRAELAPHLAPNSANLTVSGPPVMLKPQAALFMALVIHELATNATKYGALSVAGGRVDVSWKIAGDLPLYLELIWTEQGGPKINGPMKPGFGTELIERGLRFELQGEAKLEAVDGALRCLMTIPADPDRLVFVSPTEPPSREEAA